MLGFQTNRPRRSRLGEPRGILYEDSFNALPNMQSESRHIFNLKQSRVLPLKRRAKRGVDAMRL
ncbi:hypothetical protein A2U01_0074615, partial [Trifolium medium]|nr:hypothetical protein [Trifolium medium]